MNKKKNQPAGRQGFTLLELLVVIGIIGVLVSLATVAYTSAQRKSRDSRRQTDMRSIQSALEVYYAENSSPNFSYPAVDCNDAEDHFKGSWPTDPVNADLFVYTEACSTTEYCICAGLEVEGKGNASDTDCTWEAGDYYCVSNLQ
jgi:prepilin-type N-terminal cleavage/methylation domain-containing protein